MTSVIEDAKTSSSIGIETHGPWRQSFHWQARYGMFSLGASRVADQMLPHRLRSYEVKLRPIPDPIQEPRTVLDHGGISGSHGP